MRKTCSSRATPRISLVERHGGRQVVAERLLDDEAPPRVVAFRQQAGLAELAGDHGELRRRRGEIEQHVAARIEEAGERLVGLRRFELAGKIAAAFEEPVDVGRAVAALELLHALAQVIAKAVVADVTRRDADEREIVRQQSVAPQVAQGRHQQAAGQVARRAEDHQRAGGSRWGSLCVGHRCRFTSFYATHASWASTLSLSSWASRARARPPSPRCWQARWASASSKATRCIRRATSRR